MSGQQDHSNWTHTVEFSSVLHHTKFETNRFTSVLTHDDVKRIFHEITSAEFSPLSIAVHNKFSTSFNKVTGCGNRLNFICEISEKMDNNVFMSHTTVTFSKCQGHPN